MNTTCLTWPRCLSLQARAKPTWSRLAASLFLLLTVGLTPTRGAESILITEFLASNVGGLTDEDGDTSDWIELHNAGTTTVNLAGWHLTDDPGDLAKWTFPPTNLPPKGFLIVFASGKDRTVSGAPLHTSFQLDADGGFLALVQPDGATLASGYADYPPQRANYPYGVGQTISVRRFIDASAALRAWVPRNDSLGADWVRPDFNDAAWLRGTNGVGYETSVPGFAVRNVKANIQVGGLNAAEGVLTNRAQQTSVVTTNVPLINFSDNQGDGHYGNNTPFPGQAVSQNVEDFALEATATMTIPSAGAWTFGVNSDDGFRLSIGSFTIAYDPPRGPGDTLGVFNVPAAGDYPLRLVFYERGGGAEVELWAARGSYSGWGAQFRLVGDVAQGGLAVRSQPTAGGTGLGYRALIRTDVQALMLSNSPSAYVRIPFGLADVGSVTALTLQMRYDDGFVAFLNGTEVIRRNAPSSLAWNVTAPGPHSASGVEDIPLSDRLGLLVAGTNWLAIHGLNVANQDGDFLVTAELAEFKAIITSNQFLLAPTPGAFNSAGFQGFVQDTKFSPDRGFYDSNVTVTITSATDGALIRYTLNGSVPSLTNGLTYTAPLLLTNTTTLRAAAFKDGLVPSEVDTHTYVFVNDVIRQSPTGQAPGPGWPTGRSTAGQLYDYGMDPDVVNNVVWNVTIRDDLKTLPSFSVVMDLKDLFDNTRGIYANPGGDEVTWERPGSLELMHPNGDRGFQVNCGVRIRGGYSRSGDNPKHAFRFFFRQPYGAAKLNYPLFGEAGARSFDKIDLRTMQNYCWSFNGDARMVCVRDSFSRESQLDMGQAAERGWFCHLYINGQYWGLYNVDERPEASYGETYFGGRAEDYDTIKADPDLGYAIEATDGDQEAWTRLWRAATNGFASDADYFRVQGLNADGTPNPAYENLLDVDNLIDYMLVILYGGNLDAPISNFIGNNNPNNFYAIRHRGGGSGGFKFFAHDSEHTLLNVNEDRTGIDGNFNILYPAGDPVTQGAATALTRSNPQYIWFRLHHNAEFRIRAADRIQRHFFEGGALSTEACRTRFLRLSNEVERAIVAESARWGDAKVATPFTRNTWLAAVRDIWNSFLPGRSQVVLNQLKADKLFPDVVAPRFNVRAGLVPAGFALHLTNANASGTILYTLDGADPRLRGGALAPGTFVYATGTPLVMNAATRVRARVRAGTTWSALADAVFYPAQDFTALQVTEIMYNSPALGETSGDEFEFLELQNNGTNTLDLSGVGFTEGISFTFTNGTRLAPRQFFLLARNPAQLAVKYPGVVVHGIYSGKLDNGGETLTLAHPIGSRVFSLAYNDAGRWPVTPDGFGFSLVPTGKGGALKPGNALYWRASTQPGGSPGAADPPSSIPLVVINEALSHSVPPAVDRIELRNLEAIPVPLGGWFLTDDPGVPMKFRIPDDTLIPGHGYGVFTEADFHPTPGTNNSFALSSMGDEVYLLSGDAQTNLTGYSHGFRFGGADPDVSFGRHVISTLDEHFVAQTNNTFDTTNAGPRVGPMVIRQVMYHPLDLPGGLDNTLEEFIELYNITARAVRLFDEAAPTNTWRVRGGISFDFPTNVVVEPQGSVVLVNFSLADAGRLAAFRAKYGHLSGGQFHGPFGGKLNNDNDEIDLQKPGTPVQGVIPYISVDTLDYGDSSPWPAEADGGGAALRRVRVEDYGNEPTNWLALTPLAILVQPANVSARAGSNAVFQVSAVGTGRLRYQWQRDDLDLPGATNATLQLANLQPAQAGRYSVVVSDQLGAMPSQPALLTVLYGPTILQQPQPGNQIALVGSTVTLTAAADGTRPLHFRWRRSGTTFTNQLAPDGTNRLTLPNLQTTNGGTYTSVVTNVNNVTPGVLSSNAYLTVVTPLTNQVVSQGSNVTFRVNFGGPVVRFQWRFNGVLLAGQTNNVLSLTNVQPAQGGAYAATVVNPDGVTADLTATLILDSDRDGLPDAWELAHGLDPRNAADSQIDGDGDGLNNSQEFETGTNPRDPASRLELRVLHINGIQLQFQAVSNRSYSVQSREALDRGPWNRLLDVDARPTNRATIFPDTNPPGPQRFYRLLTPQRGL